MITACNLLEAALGEIYEGRSKVLRATATAINKNKGAVGKRRIN